MNQFETVEDARVYGASLLAGARVRLRALADTDLPALAAWWADPAASALQTATVRPRPEGSFEQMFRQWSGNGDPGSVGFSIEARDTGQLIGHVTLYGAALPERAATLAIILGTEHSGQGYGPDAVRTAVGYGFRQMGLNRIELRTWAFNTRARRAYESAGFKEEGRRRQAAFFDGRFHDEVIMAVLRDEWAAAGS
ncbi:Putative ribosomal N-acetyltransferase YdaF [Arthrobacter saudimassiliensis]|uniref:Putative ribosomal N-acetyltransferase YdaF n=1 Tax=Arthrobacter saudimassiliensis TaxID=1461584 RepID=A0A078MTZ9_9MICC|nr:Putative ribosomal N-acetyltransferase YdaF [Arthrobacter saudimassiliensis]